MVDFSDKQLFLLDMDGTIYLDHDLFPCTLPFLDALDKTGRQYIFLTNNSSKGVEDYVQKLTGIGLPCTRDHFYTSSMATARYLKAHHSHDKIYVFGTKSFQSELTDLNITTKYEDDVTCLCMGFDTELTFQKLEDAVRILNSGASYIATNPDYVCPTWYGSVPDCGSVTDMLFNAIGRRPHVIGKPRPDMALSIMEQLGYSKDQTVMIGDRLYTDVACGKNAGITAVLTLSGEATLADVETSDIKPDVIISDLSDIQL